MEVKSTSARRPPDAARQGELLGEMVYAWQSRVPGLGRPSEAGAAGCPQGISAGQTLRGWRTGPVPCRGWALDPLQKRVR
jgi:hypothetical protein